MSPEDYELIRGLCLVGVGVCFVGLLHALMTFDIDV